MNALPVHCPACRTDFPTAAGFREHLPACRRNDPPDVSAGISDARSRLLADVFTAEAQRYEGQGQPTEAWLLHWASQVCLEDQVRLVQRIREKW